MNNIEQLLHCDFLCLCKSCFVNGIGAYLSSFYFAVALQQLRMCFFFNVWGGDLVLVDILIDTCNYVPCLEPWQNWQNNQTHTANPTPFDQLILLPTKKTCPILPVVRLNSTMKCSGDKQQRHKNYDTFAWDYVK